MKGTIGRSLATLMLLVALSGAAAAAVLTTQSQTFLGAAASLQFPGGTPECDTSGKPVDSLKLPAVTLAPTSADTQLAWKPNGSQSSAYQLALVDPSGATAMTWAIGANSTAQVAFFKAGAAGGAWSFRESGLRSSICSNGALMGSPGSASGTASWYQ